MYDQHTRVADSLAVVSTVSAITSWAADALPWVQLVGALVAIVTGVYATIYYHKKIKEIPK